MASSQRNSVVRDRHQNYVFPDPKCGYEPVRRFDPSRIPHACRRTVASACDSALRSSSWWEKRMWRIESCPVRRQTCRTRAQRSEEVCVQKQARVRLGLVAPVGLRVVVQRLEIANGSLNPWVMSRPPPSINTTLFVGSTDRRLATTQPADPAPTMMTALASLIALCQVVRARHRAGGLVPWCPRPLHCGHSGDHHPSVPCSHSWAHPP